MSNGNYQEHNPEFINFIKDIRSNTNLLTLDEAATKQTVILKIFYLLGWNPFNIDEVYPEYSLSGLKVDYSLRHHNSNKVFVEVKRFGIELEKHQEQLLNYSFKAGVKLSVLTNGFTWWFYLPLQEGTWEQRKFYAIDIRDQDVNEIVQKFFELLSKENIVSGKAYVNAENIMTNKQRSYNIQKALPKALHKIIDEPDHTFVELITENTEKLCGFRPEKSTVESFIKTQFPNINPVSKTKTEKAFAPKTVRSSNLTGQTKIGRFAQEKLNELFDNDLSNGILYKLQDESYCKNQLDLDFPLLKKVDENDDISSQRFVGNYPRYYKNPVAINGGKYLLCSQWYERSRGPFLTWLDSMK